MTKQNGNSVSADVGPRIRPRILLDTNIWNYIVNADQVGELLDLTTQCVIQISPAVVSECLRTSDPAIRKRLLLATTKKKFFRLMPEAYSESMEILSALKVRWPAIFRTSPLLTEFDRLKKHWTREAGGFWRRCIEHPDKELIYMKELGDDSVLYEARDQYSVNRELTKSSKAKREVKLNEVVVSVAYGNKTISAWRYEAWLALGIALRTRRNAYRDWIMPFIDLDSGILESREWQDFWFSQVEPGSVPRQWLRWAHSYCQAFKQANDGTPGDNQLTTYLPDSDYFVSADRRNVSIIQELSPYSPYPLASPVLAKASKESILSIYEILSTTR